MEIYFKSFSILRLQMNARRIVLTCFRRSLTTRTDSGAPTAQVLTLNLRKDSNILDLNAGDRKEKQSGKKGKKIRWSAGSVGMLIIPAAAFSLGVWQAFRLQWKLDLIKHLKDKLNEDAVPFPEDNLGDVVDMEYRRVKLTGEFLNDREFTISPRGRFDEGHKQKDAGSLLSDNNLSSHGAHVITPFRLKKSGVVIMVNRGWVPPHLLSRQSRTSSEVNGEVTLEAIVRKSEGRPQFVGQNLPDRDVWFYKDHHQMAKQYGTAPIYVEAVSETTVPGGPIGGQTNITVRNEHLNYLITWFSLSAVTLGMWAFRFIR